MKQEFKISDSEYRIDLHVSGSGWRVSDGQRELEFEFRDLGDDRFELALPGRTAILHAVADGDTRWVAFRGRTYELRRAEPARVRRAGAADTAEGALRAPMPGQVRSVEVAAGDAVTKGQTLLLLEAMKMEIRIQAPHDGTITALPVSPGDQVEREQVLVEVAKN